MIIRTTSLIAAVSVWAGLWLGAVASDRIAPVQKVTAKGKTIVLHEGGKEHFYEFDDEELQLSEIESAKLLFQNRANEQIYLLFYVVGPSTGGGNGACGAGQEEYLIWLALDLNWGKDDQKLQLIGSCFENIEPVGSESYAIKDGKLTSEYVEFKENDDSVKNTLKYDTTTPEKGWSIQREHWANPNSQ
jgi:hypothetical protein